MQFARARTLYQVRNIDGKAASARATSPGSLVEDGFCKPPSQQQEKQREEKGRKIESEPRDSEQNEEEPCNEGFECAAIRLTPINDRELALQDAHSHEADDRLIGIEQRVAEKDDPQGGRS